MVATLLRLSTLPTLKRVGNHVNSLRDRDRALQLLPLNEEFPVSASHQLALITSLPFVHTARRYYRSSDLVRTSDWSSWWLSSHDGVPERCPNLIT